jgi:hypothetical protein
MEKLFDKGMALAKMLEREKNGTVAMVLQYLDLENELQETRERLEKELEYPELRKESFQIKLSTSHDDTDGTALDMVPTEQNWIEELVTATSKAGIECDILDIRAVMSDLPIELGLYSLRIVHRVGDTMKKNTIRVWIVPTE